MLRGLLHPTTFPKDLLRRLPVPPPAVQPHKPEGRRHKLFGVIDVPVGGASDYQRNSWRWDDEGALRFDLDDARRKRDHARAISGGANLVGGLSGTAAGADDLAKRGGASMPPFLRRFASWPVAAGAGAVGGLSDWQASHWDAVAQDVEDRLARVQGRRRTK